MALQDPTRKCLSPMITATTLSRLIRRPKSVVKKIKRAMTDSEEPPRIRYDLENKPGFLTY